MQQDIVIGHMTDKDLLENLQRRFEDAGTEIIRPLDDGPDSSFRVLDEYDHALEVVGDAKVIMALNEKPEC